MTKKLYWRLTTIDGDGIINTLDGCMQWVLGDDITETNADEYKYTLTPVYMTDEEFNNLPESNI